MPEIFTCENCRTEHSDGNQFQFDESILCNACHEEETALCDRCGERIWWDNNFGDSNITLCEQCYDHSYTTCDRCGRITHYDDVRSDDDDSSYCEACYDYHSESRVIKSYDYKPDPIFYGDGVRFLGVELEIDGAGEDNDSAAELMCIANRSSEHIYCKHDGSLSDGFELVTHPMTLDYHKSSMPWDEMLRHAISLGYRSHQAGTCGLHVHVSRNSFGKTIEEQDAAIARVLFFIENHWDEFLRFSRRTQHQLSQWAARYGRKNSPKELLDSAKDSYARYTCVNLTNYE